jgi:hypothetical protein
MGQQANSGRNASLDNRKQRAAGRQQNTPERSAIKDAAGLEKAKGKAGGAFGREGLANRKGGVSTRGAGGGGGASSQAKDSDITTGRKKK